MKRESSNPNPNPKIYRCFYSANAEAWLVINKNAEEIRFKTIKEALKYMKYGAKQVD